MKKGIGIAILTIGLVAPHSSALDKKKFAEHLQKALNQPANVEIVVDDPKPSEFEGFQEVSFTLKTQRGSQTESVYLYKDEKKYWIGSIFDTAVDYDKERVKKMDLKNVYYKGYNKAPVTIVEYSDLQCGFCKKAHDAFEKELYKNYSKRDVRLVFKHFPLGNHNWAYQGALATECAGQQSNTAFWKMTDKFFQNTRVLTPENVESKALEFAKEIGLNKRKLTACMKKEETRKKVLDNRKEGVAVGVQSTPTFYVNGRMIRGFRTFEAFKPFIDGMLKESK